MVIVIFSVILFFIFTLLTVSMVLFYRDSKYVPPPPVVIEGPLKALDECSIEELAQRIATEKINDKELLKVVDYVAKKHKFPFKRSAESADEHLRFVHQFCLNESAKASTIVKMVNTLKSVNREYARDIEQKEKQAIASRDSGTKK